MFTTSGETFALTEIVQGAEKEQGGLKAAKRSAVLCFAAFRPPYSL